MFHPIVATWLSRKFGMATPAQERAWPVARSGQDLLVAAPTGSGKTLAAFLHALDQLIRQALDGTLAGHTSIVYVSPLKALSNDVRRNLEEPLAELREISAELGYPGWDVRTAVRTGDTSQKERRHFTQKPAHVLVTTPESLYILLTSESGRRALGGVTTLILDEIHALLHDKRGAHLALSVERLERLCLAAHGRRPQRIGLSATVRPLDVAARYLVGTDRPAPVTVDVGQRRELDLGIVVPGGGSPTAGAASGLVDDLGAVATHEQWAWVYDQIAELARGHRSTLVFVNTRRLVERVTLHLGERLGVPDVAAHHGSLSRQKRFAAEQRLKAGELKVVVATASLELGIDVGAVDLVCLVGSPRSISTGLQRIGRSGHALMATPRGRLFPLTRDQLFEAAALVRAARQGLLDTLRMRTGCKDILCQQLVASCACEELGEDELFQLVRRAAPYGALERPAFDELVEMLSEGISTRRGRSGALLHRDAVGQKLRGRRGARLAAVTSGGAIPDTATYDVVLEPEGTVIGNLDEDFAIESSAGDVFLLGNTSWRIRRVEAGKVRVEDAGGAAPTIPFWLGEGPSRSLELSQEVSRLRQDLVARAPVKGASSIEAAEAGRAIADWLVEQCAVERAGAELMRDYLLAGHAQLGAVPSQECLVAERFFDESGGMQLIIHSPYGARINRAFGMALRKRFCRTFDFELQAAATDDGVILSLGPQHSFPLETIFELVTPEVVTEVLSQAALQAPMFETRWRWNATRALVLLRQMGGKRVPPQLQRLRAQDLLAAVFPGAQGCQDNHGFGPVEIPDHPLVKETIGDCLVEAMDAEGLIDLLGKLRRGDVKTHVRETPEPSVFSHEILNANPYAFLDDAPLEERRARAVSVRRGLPVEVVDRLGLLDDAALGEVVAEARPDVRSADELHDLLLDVGLWPAAEGEAAGWEPYLEQLAADRRAACVIPAGRSGGPVPVWVAAERRSLAVYLLGEARLRPELQEPPSRRPPSWVDAESSLTYVVRGLLASTGPTTAGELAARLGLPAGDVLVALHRVEADGAVLRGRFRRLPEGGAAPEGGAGGEIIEWCDRRLLSRIHRRMLDRLRREIEPVSAADLIRFLLGWQHARPGRQLHGIEGLRRVLGQLQGFEAAAGAWEGHLLPSRVGKYDRGWLDALCLSGQVVWGRLCPRDAELEKVAPRLTRAAPIALALREDLAWLLVPGAAADVALDEMSGLSHAARDVLGHLIRAGASFEGDIVQGARRLRSEVDDALWELVSAGRVTADGFSGLRALVSGSDKRATRLEKMARARGWPVARAHGAGRWALMPRAPGSEAGADEAIAEERTLQLARQYVRRYGVVFRDILVREDHVPPWRELVRVLRRLELQGELRGGRLVGGFVGEQFAAPEAVDALRAARREARSGEVVRLSACDPLNLVGILTPGPRVPATLGGQVAYLDGVPVGPGEVVPPPRPLGGAKPLEL